MLKWCFPLAVAFVVAYSSIASAEDSAKKEDNGKERPSAEESLKQLDKNNDQALSLEEFEQPLGEG